MWHEKCQTWNLSDILLYKIIHRSKNTQGGKYLELDENYSLLKMCLWGLLEGTLTVVQTQKEEKPLSKWLRLWRQEQMARTSRRKKDTKSRSQWEQNHTRHRGMEMDRAWPPSCCAAEDDLWSGGITLLQHTALGSTGDQTQSFGIARQILC